MTITTNGTADPDEWTGEGEWGQYWLGAGGTCVDRSPPVGYWCAPGAPRRISTPIPGLQNLGGGTWVLRVRDWPSQNGVFGFG